MGDKTTVIIKIRNCDTDQVIKLFETDHETPIIPGFSEFIFYDCNLGEIDGLEELVKQGIPFDKWHGNGDGYDAEYLTVRFYKNGSVQVKQWIEITEGLISSAEIKNILNQEYTCYEDQLREIETLVNNKIEKSTPLS